jgi:hypothetical protein
MADRVACSVCHPLFGTGKITKICPSLCDTWFNACKDEFYAVLSNGNMQPCFGKALLCSQGKSFADDGASFCKKMGYTAQIRADLQSGAAKGGSGRREMSVSVSGDLTDDSNFDFDKMLEEYPADPLDSTDMDDAADEVCFDGTVPAGFAAEAEAELPGWKKRTRRSSTGGSTTETMSQFIQSNAVMLSVLGLLIGILGWLLIRMGV